MYKLIIACILGIIGGFILPTSITIEGAFSLILPILLFSIGLSFGNFQLVKILRENKLFILFPFFSLFGSCLFAVIFALITHQELKGILLSGGAMGFYSLPAFMVSSQVGIYAGTLLLVTNMFREMITILFAPLIVKLFGNQAIIAVGGATTLDVSLAMIKEVAGEKFVPLAVLNGLILTVVVPFIITLILYLNF